MTDTPAAIPAEATLMCECSHHWYVHAESGQTAPDRPCWGYTGSMTPGPLRELCLCAGFRQWTGPRDSRTGEPVKPLMLPLMLTTAPSLPDTTPAEAITLAALVLHQDACDDCGTEFCNGNPMPVEFALARRVLAAVAPVIAARATDAERERICQLLLDSHRIRIALRVAGHSPATTQLRLDDVVVTLARIVADLLGGASHSAQTAPAAPGSVPKVTGPETSHEDRSVDRGATQHHPCQCQDCT